MKKLGFGCMRLPMVGGAEGTVDIPRFKQMVDLYMEAGFNYFDTAIVYINGQSETALREALVERYPRDSFILTDKLSGSQFTSEAEVLPLFERQLRQTGAGYFDYYLYHGVNSAVYEHHKECNTFEIVKRLKEEGKVRHIGISFHDKPEVLERILSEQPQLEVVQIQLNYLDWDSPSVESGAVYEVCRRYGKPVLVMEPVRGGALAKLPPAAEAELKAVGDGSPASFAIRYAASFEGVFMVLSGMSTPEQMEDNISYMRDFRPLSETERDTLRRVAELLRAQNAVPCTGCRYCVAGCPAGISIPDIFACLNNKRLFNDWSADFYYQTLLKTHAAPSACLGCGQCEGICPQHLPVPELLKTAEKELSVPWTP